MAQSIHPLPGVLPSSRFSPVRQSAVAAHLQQKQWLESRKRWLNELELGLSQLALDRSARIAG